MGVLVVPGGHAAAGAVVELLLDQGDDVRVLESGDALRGEWKAKGAHVAIGDLEDADLIERAAQGVRTIVVMGEPAARLRVISALLQGGARAGADRLVLCAEGFTDEVRQTVSSGAGEYALLTIRGGGLLRRSVAPEVVAEAVNAADDLAGEVRLELDLADPQDLERLQI